MVAWCFHSHKTGLVLTEAVVDRWYAFESSVCQCAQVCTQLCWRRISTNLFASVVFFWPPAWIKCPQPPKRISSPPTCSQMILLMSFKTQRMMQMMSEYEWLIVWDCGGMMWHWCSTYTRHQDSGATGLSVGPAWVGIIVFPLTHFPDASSSLDDPNNVFWLAQTYFTTYQYSCAECLLTCAFPTSPPKCPSTPPPPLTNGHLSHLPSTKGKGHEHEIPQPLLMSMPQLPTSGMIEVLADMQFSAVMSTYATMPHGLWGGLVNTSMAAFGLTTTREFSNAVTDCDLWVNGVNLGIRYDGTYTIGTWPNAGNCDQWTKWENYDVGTKNDICHV